jgi:hypothetical protein
MSTLYDAVMSRPRGQVLGGDNIDNRAQLDEAAMNTLPPTRSITGASREQVRRGEEALGEPPARNPGPDTRTETPFLQEFLRNPAPFLKKLQLLQQQKQVQQGYDEQGAGGQVIRRGDPGYSEEAYPQPADPTPPPKSWLERLQQENRYQKPARPEPEMT